MRKQAPNLDWQIAESDADWERRRAPALPDISSVTSRRRLKHAYWGMAALLLLLATGGSWWWRTVQTGSHQAAAELAAPAQPELGVGTQVPTSMVASHTGNLTGADRLLQHAQEVPGMPTAVQATESDAYADGPLHVLESHGDQAVKRLVSYTEHGEPAYRQTRFYRRTAAGWQQTAPSAALWGPLHSLETPSLVFTFRQNDAQAVVAVAAQLEALYIQMRRNVGLSIPSAAKKLPIVVSVLQPPAAAIPQLSGSDRVIVASPAVYLAPVELTEVDLLAQSLALALSRYVLAQASEQYALDSSWRPLLDGLRLWQLWDTDLPLAVWREDVVTWVYADLPTTRPGQAVVLPERYPALCAAHKLWMPSPTQINIPLLCAEVAWEALLVSPWGWYEPLTRLDQLVVPLRPGEYLEEPVSLRLARHPGHTVALATLIEYAVTTYGQERLPALVAGLGHYDSWETLLPAVFGVPVAEFEAGWQAYLADRYAVPVR